MVFFMLKLHTLYIIDTSKYHRSFVYHMYGLETVFHAHVKYMQFIHSNIFLDFTKTPHMCIKYDLIITNLYFIYRNKIKIKYILREKKLGFEPRTFKHKKGKYCFSVSYPLDQLESYNQERSVNTLTHTALHTDLKESPRFQSLLTL